MVLIAVETGVKEANLVSSQELIDHFPFAERVHREQCQVSQTVTVCFENRSANSQTVPSTEAHLDLVPHLLKGAANRQQPTTNKI